MAKRKMRRFNGEDGSDVDALEAANASKESQEIAGEAMLKGMRDMEAAPRKAPIVTKEELAASGLSLRDYLNKQQGLTRRGEAAPKAAPKETTVEKTVVKTEPAKAAPRVGRAGQAAVDMSTASQTTKPAPSSQESFAAKQTRYQKEMSDMPIARMFKAIRERGESTKGYAKGGSVGSASKRADGIAQRGKTRGKIC